MCYFLCDDIIFIDQLELYSSTSAAIILLINEPHPTEVWLKLLQLAIIATIMEENYSFKQYLTCPCCEEELTAPITLPCFHSFCLKCLKSSHNTQRQREEERRASKRDEEIAKQQGIEQEGVQDFSIKGLQSDYHTIPNDHVLREEEIECNRNPVFFCCPLEKCYGVTNVPLGSNVRLNDLKINSSLLNIVHTLSMKKGLPQGRVACGSCGNTAIGVCYNKDCNNHPYCGDCLEFHLRDNKRHSIAYPTDTVNGQPAMTHSPNSSPPTISTQNQNTNYSRAGNIAWEDLKQCDVLCEFEDHERFFRNLYCKEHDDVICLACTGNGGLHRRCDDIAKTREIYDECLAVTNEKLNKVEKLHDYFRAAIRTTEEVKRALEAKVVTVKESVEARYAILDQELKSHRERLLKNCDSVYNHKTDELRQHLEILNRIFGTLEHSVLFVNQFNQLAIPSEFMMLKMQIDERLDELASKYSRYKCETREDDCIFLEENKQFTFVNAIGRVFSTPSVKKFTISATTNIPVARQPVYLTVTTRDVIGNELLCHTTMPKICATIRHIDDSENERIKGTVERDQGKYYVMVFPSRSGWHEICVYQPLDAPYDKCFVGGKKYIINVDI